MIHSCVSQDQRKTFCFCVCVCDSPTPEAIRASARTSNLPVDGITPVSVLDPYFYKG